MPESPPYATDALRWVAAEVRYPLVESLAAGVPSELHGRIRGRFPIHEEQTEVAVTVGATGPAAQQTVRSRFLSRDRLMSVTVGRDALVLETTSYAGWTAFEDLLLEVLGALQETVRPDGIGRIGLRYIDEIRIPDGVPTIADWKEWVDERLVAPFTLDDVALPTGATIALQYGAVPGYATVFRAAPFAAGRTVQNEGPLRMPFDTPDGPYFLLDTDASWTDPQRRIPEFDLDEIKQILDNLHDPCKRLFERSITARLRDEILNRTPEELWGQ